MIKDGWLCSTCRVVERSELDDNKFVCATDGCDNLHQACEKQRVCTWCRMPLPPAWRLQALEMVPPRGRVPNTSNNDEVPEYRPRIEEEPDSPVEGVLRKAKSTDKVRVAGWDTMSEEARKEYEEAWLKKGAREREGERVYRSRDSAGESSGAGGLKCPEDNDEVPEFTDEDGSAQILELREPSGTGGGSGSGSQQIDAS